MPKDAGKPEWQDEDLLRELYINQDLSQREIASRLDCSKGTISKWLLEFDITKNQFDGAWRDESTLKTLYIEQGLNSKEIAEELGCDDRTVAKWLQRTGVVDEVDEEPWRDKETLASHYYSDKTQQEIADELGCTRAAISYWVTKLGIADIRNDVEFDSATSHKHPWHDKERLKEVYQSESYDITKTAGRFDTTPETIERWLERYDIKVEGCDGNPNRSDYPKTKPWQEKWVLEELYVEHGMSTNEIGRFLNCAQSTVHDWIQRHSISVEYFGNKPSKEELQELYQSEKLSTLDIATRYDADKAAVYRLLEDHSIPIRDSSRLDRQIEELRDREWVKVHYLEKEKSLTEISLELGCSRSTVGTWIEHHGFDIRPAETYIQGQDHPKWQGGPEPYGAGWNEQKREQVRERDNRKCQSCGMEEGNHLEDHNRRLHVHHIIPARQFESDQARNDKGNLVTLCQICHIEWEGIPLRPQFVDTE